MNLWSIRFICGHMYLPSKSRPPLPDLASLLSAQNTWQMPNCTWKNVCECYTRQSVFGEKNDGSLQTKFECLPSAGAEANVCRVLAPIHLANWLPGDLGNTVLPSAIAIALGKLVKKNCLFSLVYGTI